MAECSRAAEGGALPMAAVLPPIVMILIVGLIFYFAKRAADKEK